MSEFCRYAVLGKEVRHIEGLDKCGYGLNKIGTNLNQIALLCHQRAVQNPNLDEISKQLCGVTERIYDVLGGVRILAIVKSIKVRKGNLDGLGAVFEYIQD